MMAGNAGSTYKGIKGQELTVEICRDGLNAPWGFRLYGGTDFESPLIVQRVIPASAASDSLQTGDVIIKINDMDALRLRHAQVLDLIAAAGSSLKLTLLRGGGHHAPPRSQSRGTTPVHGTLTSDDADPKVPRLADIMKESLQLKEQGQLHTIRTQGFRGTPLSRRSPQLPSPNPPSSHQSANHQQQQQPDIASYLPQMPPRRAGSRNRSETPQRIAPSMANSIGNPPPTNISYYPTSSMPNRSTIDQHHQQQPSSSLLSPTSSGRSSPSSSVIELGDPNAPKPVGVWIPPVHQPNAKLVHMQFNSPLGLYSAYNVADSVEKMTGTRIAWMNQQPGSRYLDDIRESPTYKFVQEMEGRTPATSTNRSKFEQSRTIKNLNRYFQLDDPSSQQNNNSHT